MTTLHTAIKRKDEKQFVLLREILKKRITTGNGQ